MNQRTSGDCLAKYIGIPYKKLDCYDLIRYFYSEEFNVNLPTQEYDNRNSIVMHGLRDKVKQKFEKTKNPIYGDIVILRSWGMPVHVGIYINKLWLLHSEKRTGSVLARFEKWNKRIEGFYRWQSSK